MKTNIKLSLVIVSAAVFGSVSSYFIFRSGGEPEFSRGKVVQEDGSGDGDSGVTGSVAGNNSAIPVGDKNDISVVRVPEPPQNAPEQPPEDAPAIDDIDEEKLSDGQKAVLNELQDALDDNNVSRVRKAIAKFQAKSVQVKSVRRVPVCMRSRAVQALGWFGKETAVDLLEFVVDPNEGVSTDAFSQFEMALSDGEMGDVERSKLVSSMMKALTDADQIDSILSQLNDMRNSVKAQTAIEILSSGTDVAKAKLMEDLELYFDENVNNITSLEQWKVMNQDSADDNETYGGATVSKGGSSEETGSSTNRKGGDKK